MCADAKRLGVDRGERAGSPGEGGRCLTRSISDEQKGVKKEKGVGLHTKVEENSHPSG